MPPSLRLLGVLLFLGLILAIFEITGLRGHFSLEFLRQTILDNRVGGLVVFVLVFALGNLIQIPGWVFLAATVLALGRTWGGVATYIAASGSARSSLLELYTSEGCSSCPPADRWLSGLLVRTPAAPRLAPATNRLARSGERRQGRR